MSTYETVIVAGMALWIAVAVGLLVAVLYLIGALRAARAPIRRITAAVESLQGRLQPVIRNVERASEDVNYLVGSLRTDLSQAGDTARRAAESADRMIGLVEERVIEMAALLEVVQEEAEETFLSTASLLRGIRRGRRAAGVAGSLGRAVGGRRR